VNRISWALLILAGLLANGNALGWIGRAVPPDLGRLAGRSYGEFAPLERIAVAPESLGDLPPERWLFHSYATPGGAEGVMFAAYYLQDRRWSGRPHPVEVCFVADGWSLDDRRVLHASSGARYDARHLTRGERRILVVHWTQHPGALPGEDFLRALRRRASGASGLRRDVLSVYWEFELDTAPPDAALTAACEELREAVEALWH
jgi:hypothetical protein